MLNDIEIVERPDYRKENTRILEAYMRMLLDGTAFCNWKNPPNETTRLRLVESLIDNKAFDGSIDISQIQKVIMESKNEEELKRMFSDMEIKEDDFKV